ncbi:hypothetical protein FB451DRAFT_1390134 [Mycena latifolia]|nr:hypothetical protein FB451DRAFT_1390134 [Mycena latifolia]
MASPIAHPAAIPGAPTPIRAITTCLCSSAAPPIPAAAQLYEPLAKAVLRRRIFPATGALGVGLLGLLGAAAGMWVAAMLPVLLVRKAFLTGASFLSFPLYLLLCSRADFGDSNAHERPLASPPPPKSLAPNTGLRARTLRAAQAHLLSALSVLALHALLDPTLPVFIRS